MNIEEIRARAEAATAETNVFHRTKPLMPEDLELSLADDGYNPCLLRIMAHALFDIPALLDALEAKERELAAVKEENGWLEESSKIIEGKAKEVSAENAQLREQLEQSDKCKNCDFAGKVGCHCARATWRGAGKEQNDG